MKLIILLSCMTVTVYASPFSWLQNMNILNKYQATEAYQQQDYDRALQHWSALLDKNPYDPESNYNIGNIFYHQKKYADAKQAYVRATQHAQQSARLQEQAYFNLGNSCYQLNEWQGAVDAYRQVLASNDQNKSAQHNLQLALYKLQEQKFEEQEKKADDHKQQEHQHEQQKDQQQGQCQNSQSSSGNQSDQKNGSQDQKSLDANKDQQSQEQSDQQNSKKSSSQKDSQDQESDGQESDGDQASQEASNQQGTQTADKNQQSMREKQQQEQMEKASNAGKTDPKDDDMSDEKSSSQSALKNKIQDSVSDQQDHSNQDDRGGQAGLNFQDADQHTDDPLDDNNGQQELVARYKKPELKNQLQDEYESKASDDKRLNDYHASVMKTLEDLEEKIQKHVIKNKVAEQGAGKNGKKGW